jgi:Rieske Fe-S protein
VLTGAVALLVVASVVAWPSAPSRDAARWAPVASLDDLRVNEPVHVKAHGLWLVKLESGELLALYERDPHLGCSVPWRPDFEFMGKKGWFRNPCHGETYDLLGRCFSGPCVRGLDRFPVRVANFRFEVNVAAPIPGPEPASGIGPVNPN